jgi:glycosyltransferase involved in cell wall biosynthesis
LIIGIDAANLRGGGGVTHLVEVLRAIQPERYGIDRIVIWGGVHSLNLIDDRPWIDKRSPPTLNGGLIKRTLWQRFRLSAVARIERCDVLFVPGGSFAGNFHPVVTMSRNLLPFEMSELLRYGWSLFTLKLLLLRLTQSSTFRKVDGVIFLTKYAENAVLRITGKLNGKTCIIPHGLNMRFSNSPKQQYAIANYDAVRPYRLLYVSVIDYYKHQWNVVEAVATLRKMGFHIELHLVGPANPTALQKLNLALDIYDAKRCWVHYHGAIPFEELHKHYAQADIGLFASSCENMPNILLETMAAGLPVACSNRGPMPEILADTGIFFNPEIPSDITFALEKLIESPRLRKSLAMASHARSKRFTWQRCADETIGFLSAIAQKQMGK